LSEQVVRQGVRVPVEAVELVALRCDAVPTEDVVHEMEVWRDPCQAVSKSLESARVGGDVEQPHIGGETRCAEYS